MNTIMISTIVLALFLTGCATTAPTPAPLEAQSYQTRLYDNEKELVFQSVLSTFHYLGYTVKSAEKETGKIALESATDATMLDAIKIFLRLQSPTETSATAFVENVGEKTKVTLNLYTIHGKASSAPLNYETNEHTYRIQQSIIEEEAYKNCFDRIENELLYSADL